ncbi:MAG: peptidoglycan DD-metalloendopeptidase family protein [Rhizobiaceae bacterium]|nr:peptidoglycan DD-metalloendopeptidase family protein [Rhizobiaceae bacterium]MCV0409118.1 peptidoglycan DD-metalloendopeptidase family protein [Rhizobiaceae bacterium]
MAATVAGCSSGVSRFNSVDDIFTGSTPNQRSIIRAPEYQPYPGDTRQAQNPTGLDPNYTGSVPATQTQPRQQAVARQPLPSAQQAAASQTAARSSLDNTVTGTTPAAAPKADRLQPPSRQAAAPSDVDGQGWSRAGGTEITAREGETVYNLSKRYGVPTDAILRANGLSSAEGLKAGQKVVIPTYVYSAATKVSAPDASRDVADAKSSRGTRYDIKPGNVPLPTKSPENEVAVLPQGPKLREGEGRASSKTADSGSYVVQPGDSLYVIARKTGAKVEAIKAANNLNDQAMIRVGQKLVIPSGNAPATTQAVARAADKPGLDPVETVGVARPAKQAGETSPVTAYTPPARPGGQAIDAAVNSADEAAPDSTGIGAMRWPVRGRVVKAFAGGANDGIDISVPEGTPVKAAENGVVIYAGDGLKDFGNTVLVRHEDGLVTVYGHASEITVQRGDKVRRGQEIAKSGMSGNAEAPKLHFEIRKDSTPVDPAGFLE